MIEGQHQSPTKRRPQLHELDHKWAVKFWLRFVAFILVIVGIISFGIAASYYNGFGHGVSGFTINPRMPNVLPIIPLGISFLYNSLHFVLLCLRHRLPHPGLIVAIDLILWVFLIVTAVLAILGGAFWWCNTYNGSLMCDEYAGSQIYDQAIWEMVGIVTLGVCSLLHFALFTIACRDTDLLRKRRKYASEAHVEEKTVSNSPPPNTHAIPLPSPSNPTEVFTPTDPNVLPYDRNELPSREAPYNELASGQTTHRIELIGQHTYPVELENKSTVWPPEMEDRNLIYPPSVMGRGVAVGGNTSEDNSPVIGHPAMGSVDKEFEARMQLERDAADHPAFRQLSSKEKEMRA
ncbi:MAG: hypothetical protein M1835_007876 [Candelina submexicana]|nr:MAG: hypothetical protein M1835_007876 [Candelina submexicana]